MSLLMFFGWLVREQSVTAPRNTIAYTHDCLSELKANTKAVRYLLCLFPKIIFAFDIRGLWNFIIENIFQTIEGTW